MHRVAVLLLLFVVAVLVATIPYRLPEARGQPVYKGDLGNAIDKAIVTSMTDTFATDLTIPSGIDLLRIRVSASASVKCYARRTQDVNVTTGATSAQTLLCVLNSDVALPAGAAHVFDIDVIAGEKWNVRFSGAATVQVLARSMTQVR